MQSRRATSLDTVHFFFHSFSLSPSRSISFISNLVLYALYDDDDVKDMKHEPRWKHKKNVVSMTTDTHRVEHYFYFLFSTRQAIEEQTEFFLSQIKNALATPRVG